MSADWTCNDCGNYDPENTNWRGWGYCTERNQYYPKSDKACSNKFDHKSDYVPMCFLTTAICDMLGMDDNCYGLNVMRNFRDTILVNDSRYYPLLAEYEVVGPVISDNMYKDKHGVQVAEYYFENYIYDIIMNLSTRRDYNDAIGKYVQMVNDFKRMYGVTKEVNENDVHLLGDKIQRKEYKVKRLVRVKDELK